MCEWAAAEASHKREDLIFSSIQRRPSGGRSDRTPRPPSLDITVASTKHKHSHHCALEGSQPWLRMMSPMTIPLTPPSGFWSALNWPGEWHLAPAHSDRCCRFDVERSMQCVRSRRCCGRCGLRGPLILGQVRVEVFLP